MKQIGSILLLALLPVNSQATTPGYSFSWTVESEGEFPGEPVGIEIDNVGNVYVTDYANCQIHVYSQDGALQRSWGSYGTGPGQFSWSGEPALGMGGFVFAVDNDRIQQFTSDGTHVRDLGGQLDPPLSLPSAVAITQGGHILVADTEQNRVVSLSGVDDLISIWGDAGTAEGLFRQPAGICTDPFDNVFVVDYGNNRVQKFTAGGTFILAWGTAGSGTGQFLQPIGIASDASGNVYVVDKGNSRIQVFDGQGTFLEAWGGGAGSEPGQFSWPNGIAVSAEGLVYVADTDNHRIQVFSRSVPVRPTTWSAIKSGDVRTAGESQRP